MPTPKYIKELLERFYDLYESERKNKNAPIHFIDFFKAREFLLDEVIKATEQAVREAVTSLKEKIITDEKPLGFGASLVDRITCEYGCIERVEEIIDDYLSKLTKE